MGIANIAQNGFRLGWKKTLGKVFQPINAYTRFPQYHFMGGQVAMRLRSLASRETLKVLDVGSPKCFGLYLAFHSNIEVHLTDIDAASVEESEILWSAIRRRARGKALFSVQDARELKYCDQAFDIVYSMSVIEHVEGQAGDSKSLQEMLRVLKPGGLLLVTVPIGQNYVEQDRVGFQRAVYVPGDQIRHFFTRIYSPATAEERIIKAIPRTTLLDAVTVCRKQNALSRLHRRLGDNAQALLGCFNPLLSVALNYTQRGILPAPSSYGDLHSEDDSYGHLMLAWENTSDNLKTC
jgi:SAM-dependent methyltransferase